MKKFLIITVLASTLFYACDKVENAYPTDAVSEELNWSLYPGGDSTDYVTQGYWPTWAANPNTQRNVLIEDFTGHQCVNCPAQTANMEQLIATNPSRIFGLAIHSGPDGLGGFQITDEHYPTVLYCENGFTLGRFFGDDDPGSSFIGNPAFCVNRIKANDQFVSTAGAAIANKANTCLSSSLQVNLQAVNNYFASTRGLFLHVEIDKIDQAITSELGLVVCVVEDSLIAPQTVPNTMDTDGTPGDPDLSHKDGRLETYIHRDILRGMIDNKPFGRTLDADDLGQNGKYYVNYSYALPAQYEPENMKLYIYVYDKTTKEIYHVIEKHFL